LADLVQGIGLDSRYHVERTGDRVGGENTSATIPLGMTHQLSKSTGNRRGLANSAVDQHDGFYHRSLPSSELNKYPLVENDTEALYFSQYDLRL